MDSGATHNFITQDLVCRTGAQCEVRAPIVVTMADQSSVRTTGVATVKLRILDNSGKLVEPLGEEISCIILENLPTPLVLGMPWLKKFNPEINWM